MVFKDGKEVGGLRGCAGRGKEKSKGRLQYAARAGGEAGERPLEEIVEKYKHSEWPMLGMGKRGENRTGRMGEEERWKEEIGSRDKMGREKAGR